MTIQYKPPLPVLGMRKLPRRFPRFYVLFYFDEGGEVRFHAKRLVLFELIGRWGNYDYGAYVSTYSPAPRLHMHVIAARRGGSPDFVELL